MSEWAADGLRAPGATVCDVARKLAIVGLVLLLILLIIPVGIGMAMGGCPECSATGIPMLGMVCATLAAAILVLALMISTGLVAPLARPPGWVTVGGLERPPRSS